MTECNLEEYRQDIAAFNLSKEQEDELLRTLWEIMRAMVEIGLEVDALSRMNLPSRAVQTSKSDE